MYRKYSVNINTIIAFFMFFSFVEISALKQLEGFKFLLNTAKICFMFFLGLFVIIKIFNKKIKISKINMLLILLELEVFVVTIFINTQNIWTCLKYIIPLILISIYFENIEKKNYKYYFSAFSNLTFIYIVFNLISVILFPEGVYRGIQNKENYYFLGHNNMYIRKILPGIMLSGFFDYMICNKIRLKTKFMAILLMITVTLTWSNVSMICAIIYLVYIFALDKINVNKLLSSKMLYAIPIIVFLAIISIDKFSNILVMIGNVFGKDSTLTGRTVIWEAGFDLIKENLFFGYGYGDIIKITFSEGYSRPFIFSVSSFHNYFIDILYQGGIVCFLWTLMWLFEICNSIGNDENKIGQYIKVCVFIIFILWNTLPCNNIDSIFLIVIMGIFANYRKIKQIDKDDSVVEKNDNNKNIIMNNINK